MTTALHQVQPHFDRDNMSFDVWSGPTTSAFDIVPPRRRTSTDISSDSRPSFDGSDLPALSAMSFLNEARVGQAPLEGGVTPGQERKSSGQGRRGRLPSIKQLWGLLSSQQRNSGAAGDGGG